MKIEPFSGYKSKLYKMLSGDVEKDVVEFTNKVIADNRNISIEAAKNKRKVRHKECVIIINHFIGVNNL